MDRRSKRPSEGTSEGNSGDERSSGRESRPSGTVRSALARTVHQHRAFLELARLVAGGEQGLWTGALPVLLEPLGASWGAAYRVSGGALELVASEALPVALRAHVEGFELVRHAAFAACRAVRSRRAVSDERLFTGVVEARAAAQLEAAGVAVGIAVPVVHGGEVFGVLVVGAVTRETLDADALTFLDAAASLLAPVAALAESAARAGADERRADDRRSPSSPRLAKQAAVSRKSTDMGRIALDAVKQVAATLQRAGTDLRMAVDDDCYAAGEPGDVQLAIVHLVTNAAEAAAERAPGAGAPSQPRRVRLSVVREGTAIAVGIEDSGRGVPHDLRARMFEPGFTTKGTGRGRGLHVVRQLAMKLGGHLEVASSDLGGASFRLILPASAVRPQGGGSGTWRNGATLPQLRSGQQPREARDGEDDEGEPDSGLDMRRAVVSW